MENLIGWLGLAMIGIFFTIFVCGGLFLLLDYDNDYDNDHDNIDDDFYSDID